MFRNYLIVTKKKKYFPFPGGSTSSFLLLQKNLSYTQSVPIFFLDITDLKAFQIDLTQWSFVRSAYISWCNSIKTPGAFAPGVLMLMYILLRGLDSTNLIELDSCELMKFSWNKIRISGFKTMFCRVKSFYFFLSRYSESNCFLKYCKYNCHCNDCPACDTYDTK